MSNNNSLQWPSFDKIRDSVRCLHSGSDVYLLILLKTLSVEYKFFVVLIMFFSIEIFAYCYSRSLYSFTFSRVLSLHLSSTTSCLKPCNFSFRLVVNNIAFVLAALNARLLLEDQVSMFESSLVSKDICARFYIFRFAMSIYC